MIKEYVLKLSAILDKFEMLPNVTYVVKEENPLITPQSSEEDFEKWLEFRKKKYPEFFWFMSKDQLKKIWDIDEFLTNMVIIYERLGMLEWKEM